MSSSRAAAVSHSPLYAQWAAGIVLNERMNECPPVLLTSLPQTTATSGLSTPMGLVFLNDSTCGDEEAFLIFNLTLWSLHVPEGHKHIFLFRFFQVRKHYGYSLFEDLIDFRSLSCFSSFKLQRHIVLNSPKNLIVILPNLIFLTCKSARSAMEFVKPDLD